MKTMKTLQQCKEEVARARGIDSWKTLRELSGTNATHMEHFMTMAANSYAGQYAEILATDDRYARGWRDATDRAVAAVKQNYEPHNPTAG